MRLSQIRAILKFAYNRMRAAARRIIGYPVLYNVNKVGEENHCKRALLIYLVKPFLMKEDDPRFLDHQNLRQCKQIASIIGEFGYIVDVADVQDQWFKPSRYYDLVISHRVDLDPTPFSNSFKVYLSTGMNHVVHNRNLRNRYQNLKDRKGCSLNVHELHTEQMLYVASSSAIVGFGNNYILNTWGNTFQVPLFPFNNYGFRETKYVEKKNYPSAKKNFLFFGSRESVRKGLDLLLEVFSKNSEIDLYICAKIEYDFGFVRCYHRELFETPNIHWVGYIGSNSKEFYDLVHKCAYVILPSCAEGQAGSVVQCMYSGMIPVVTRETGIDMEDFGILLENDSLEEIEKTVHKLAKMPESWLKEHSLKTRKIAEDKFSEEVFIFRWREIINELLHQKEIEQ